MADQLDDVIQLIERYGACAALAVGGALIVVFADVLVWGPLAPRVIGTILLVFSGGLASYVGLDFIRRYQETGRIRLLFAVLLSVFLSVAGLYFVTAAVQAAKLSAAG